MWVFFVVEVLVRLGSCVEACTEKCNQPILIYDTLKCIPIFESTTDCCPAEYDCSNVENISNANSNVRKCYFEGKSYDAGHYVDDNDIEANCMVNCFCRPGNPEYKRETARFLCRFLECQERLGNPKKPECYWIFDIKKCCSVGTLCDPSPGTCDINNQTIRIGERYNHPTEACTNCVCQEGFKGEYKEPFCKKQKCIPEIQNQEKVYGFCAPTYLVLAQCCPHIWICPEATDIIMKSNKTTNHKCRFGKKLLNVGDSFSRTNGSEMVFCNCSIPPYLTCIASHNYDPSHSSRTFSSSSSAIAMLSLITSSFLFILCLGNKFVCRKLL